MHGPGGFAEHVVELLAPLGAVCARRMFGGQGVYCDGLMFALIADDVLYFKADNETRPALELAGSAPFVYEAKGRRVVMSYWRAPDEVLESAPIALQWARQALGAALRANAAKRARQPPPQPAGARLIRRK